MESNQPRSRDDSWKDALAAFLMGGAMAFIIVTMLHLNGLLH